MRKAYDCFEMQILEICYYEFLPPRPAKAGLPLLKNCTGSKAGGELIQIQLTYLLA